MSSWEDIGTALRLQQRSGMVSEYDSESDEDVAVVRKSDDVALSGTATENVMLADDDDEDDWVPLDLPDNSKTNDREASNVDEGSDLRRDEEGKESSAIVRRSDGGGGSTGSSVDDSGDLDVLAEVHDFLFMLLHHISKNNPHVMLAVLLQFMALYLYLTAYIGVIAFLTVPAVYYMPVMKSFLDQVVEEKMLNKVLYLFMFIYHLIQIRSLGFLLNYMNHLPMKVQVTTYAVLVVIAYLTNYSNRSLQIVYAHVLFYLYTVTLFLSHHYPVNGLSRQILAANFFHYMTTFVARGKIDLFENVKRSMKSYSLDKFEKLAQSPESSTKVLSFILNFVLLESKGSSNELSFADQLRKVDAMKLNEDYKNYEKLVKNVEITDEWSYLYYMRNTLTLLAFLEGNFFVNVGSLILMMLEIVRLLNTPSLAERKHLFFGEFQNIATLHDRILLSLKIYKGVVISVGGYQTTMAVYDAYVTFRNVLNVVGVFSGR